MNCEASLWLKARLGKSPTLVMPDAFDGLSARLIEHAGFEAVQCSGFSMAMAAGYVAETNLSFSENLETTRKIVNATRLPVMADGEDGFGDSGKLSQAIREFIRIGVAGINIEDQVLNAWGGGKAVIPVDLAADKIALARKVAAEEGNPGFVLNARTDALAVAADKAQGLRDAVERANRFFAAGADLAFITGVTTLDEVKFLKEQIGGPISIAAGLPYNAQTLDVRDLVALGIGRVSLPVALLGAAIQGMAEILRSFQAGNHAAWAVPTVTGLGVLTSLAR